MNRRRAAHWRGVLAEYYCVLFLLIKGYSILALRYKHPRGEVDIIAHKGNALIFVEVKARVKPEDALLSITDQKKVRTMQGALGYIANQSRFQHHDLRFDVMVVTSRLRIIHLANAWSVA